MSFKFKSVTIQLYISFFVVMSIMIALDYLEQFFILFLTVTIHEMTHIMIAKIFGLSVEKISITPMGEAATIKDMDSLSFIKKAAVIAGGPMINILIFLIMSTIAPHDSFFKLANIVIGVFNLIPIYPLDGGRLILHMLSNKIGIMPSNKAVLSFSKFMSGVIIFLGFIQVVLYPFNISLICIGFYLRKICKTEYLHMTLEFYKNIIIKNNKLPLKKQMPIRTIILTEAVEIKEMIHKICWDYYFIFLISKDGIIKKRITEHELINHVASNGISGFANEFL